MLTIDVKNQMAALRQDVQLEQKSFRSAASQALNTAARGHRTDANRELRKRYPKLKLADISGLFSINFASPSSLTATVFVQGRPLSLQRFYAGQVTTPGSGGVWVNVKGQKRFVPHAWQATMRNNMGGEYNVIMIRDYKDPAGSRYRNRGYKLKVLRTVDIPGALNIKEVRQVLEDLAIERFEKEYGRQLDRRQIAAYVG